MRIGLEWPTESVRWIFYKKGPGCLMISDRGPFVLWRLASFGGSCVRIFEHIFACENGWVCSARAVSSCVELGVFVCGVAYVCCGEWLLTEWRGGCEGWVTMSARNGSRLPIERGGSCEGVGITGKGGGFCLPIMSVKVWEG